MIQNLTIGKGRDMHPMSVAEPELRPRNRVLVVLQRKLLKNMFDFLFSRFPRIYTDIVAQ